MNKQSLIKIFATILLFSLAIFNLNILEMLNMLANSNILLITFSLFFLPILYSIRVLKWDILLRSVGLEHSRFTVFRILLIGMFYGLITPGKSGEVIRAYYLDSEKSITIPTIIWDKIIDIFVLIILSVLSILFLFYDTKLYFVAIFLIVIFFLVLGIFLNKKITCYFLSLININKNSAKQFMETIHVIKNDKMLMLELFTLSICYYSFAIIMSEILLKALRSEINPYAVFILPIIVLVGNIPITISGLGLREYIAVISFGLLGESAATGFSFSILIFFTITLIPGLIGYIFILKDTQREKNMDHNIEKVGQVSGLFSPILEKWRLKKIIRWIYGDTILDCGCGTGKILEYLPSTISKYTGIDNNENSIEKAIMRETSFETKFLIVQLGKNSLEFNEKYNTIIMSAFIEHLDNPLLFLKDIKNFLKSKGRIIITTPSSKSEDILNIGSKFRFFSSEAFHEHKNHFSKEALIDLIDKADLNIIHYEKFEFGFNQLIILTRREIHDK